MPVTFSGNGFPPPSIDFTWTSIASPPVRRALDEGHKVFCPLSRHEMRASVDGPSANCNAHVVEQAMDDIHAFV